MSSAPHLLSCPAKQILWARCLVSGHGISHPVTKLPRGNCSAAQMLCSALTNKAIALTKVWCRVMTKTGNQTLMLRWLLPLHVPRPVSSILWGAGLRVRGPQGADLLDRGITCSTLWPAVYVNSNLNIAKTCTRHHPWPKLLVSARSRLMRTIVSMTLTRKTQWIRNDNRRIEHHSITQACAPMALTQLTRNIRVKMNISQSITKMKLWIHVQTQQGSSLLARTNLKTTMSSSTVAWSQTLHLIHRSTRLVSTLLTHYSSLLRLATWCRTPISKHLIQTHRTSSHTNVWTCHTIWALSRLSSCSQKPWSRSTCRTMRSIIATTRSGRTSSAFAGRITTLRACRTRRSSRGAL